LLPSHCTAQV